MSKSKYPDDVLACHMRGLSGYNSKGEEIPDPKPLELPIGFTRPRTLNEDIQAMMSNVVQQELAERGMETWEEANDFETGEQGDFFSPHEDDVDPHHTLAREAEMRSGTVQTPDFKENENKIKSLYEDFSKKARRRSSDASKTEDLTK